MPMKIIIGIIFIFNFYESVYVVAIIFLQITWTKIIIDRIGIATN